MTLARPFSTKNSKPASAGQGHVVLGEDWGAGETPQDKAQVAVSRHRGLMALNRSPIARKILIFNLMALVLMVAGMLFLNPFRDSLVVQREAGLISEARLIAHLLEGRGEVASGPERLAGARAGLATGTEVFLYEPTGALLGSAVGQSTIGSLEAGKGPTYLTDFLGAIWNFAGNVLPGAQQTGGGQTPAALSASLVEAAAKGQTVARTGKSADGATLFSVATPVYRGGVIEGVVALTSAAGEIDQLVANEREQVLRMFIVAVLVSIVLSLVLASTIANPLSDLADAAEVGRDRNARTMSPSRIRIPDLTGRPDEIGRLSGALRGMVTALYDRIDANEQFAADVSHEIKNPLASLRSAVGSLRVVKKEEHREKLLDVIEHDVRRLDRLVSDISNASRLDSELVKEDEEQFNLVRTLENINEYLAQQAAKGGVDFITDLPSEPVLIKGLEERLAQVFVNLITNAISFCEEGDAVRVWLRRRENRVLIVVEDTGPGIPEQALTKVFKRFYSERPVGQFGEHSGLGLSISKQIVEAHGGVIWAENIRPSHQDATSEPLGARFVVGLPV